MSSDSTYATDYLQIVEVMNLYGRAMDGRRWELMDDVFVEDAVAAFPSIELHGREQIVTTIKGAMDVCDATHHVFTNHLVEVHGDSCDASMYVRAYHERADGDGVLRHDYYGSYTATLIRTPVGWRVNRWAEHTTAILGASQREFFSPIELPDMLTPDFTLDP